MIFRRRKQERQKIDQAAEDADRHLRRAQEFVTEMGKIAEESRTIRLENGFGEAVYASFHLRRRKGTP